MMAKHKHIHLTARRDFGDYKRGDHIEDEAEVKRILGSELKHHVVKVPADIEPVAKAAVAPVAEAAADIAKVLETTVEPAAKSPAPPPAAAPAPAVEPTSTIRTLR